MKFLKIASVVPLIMFSLLLTGCGGADVKTSSTTTTTTLGQELLDLKKARDQGVITDKEYETMKQDIMKKRQ
jgi:hypothetical protein